MKIAVIPGDGIGKEVAAIGLDVLDAVSEISSFKYTAETFDIGAERYLRTGELLTDGDISELRKHDSIYFGAIGDPRVKPGILEKGILLKMRSVFDQYINLRPISSWHPFVPLKKHFDFDIHFLRENTEDFYMGAGGRLSRKGKSADIRVKRELYSLDLKLSAEGLNDDMAFEIGLLSRKGIERFADYSFAYAEKRGHSKITLVDKANVCTDIYGMQRTIFEEKAKEYGIALEYMLVDAMAMAMIVRPNTFGTVAVPNLFGDILTDLGSQLQGGLGLGASGNINPKGLSMFEPIHGSAPDIAGMDKANPVAAILAAKMMLDNSGFSEEGKIIQDAVRRSLDEGKMTGDLGGKLGTKAVGKEICSSILNRRK